MKKYLLFGFALIITISICRAEPAEAREWTMDKAHSNIYFSVTHIYSQIHGTFNQFSADISFDPDHPDQSSFSFEIEVDSIDTRIAKRDKHLISEDFFNAGSHPLITFTSHSISDEGDNIYIVNGTLTIKGNSYELALPLELAGIKEHPAQKGSDVIGFNGTLTIDRLAYQVGDGKFYKMGIVGKDVDVIVSLELLADN